MLANPETPPAVRALVEKYLRKVGSLAVLGIVEGTF
jgi:hypothetical protein